MKVLSRRAAQRAALLSLVSIGAVAAGLVPVASAQTTDVRYQFDIQGQSLESALVQFTKVTGVQLVYQASLAQGLSTNGVQGQLTPDEALARLLSGSGLTFRRMGSGSITIEQTASADAGERVLGAVRVQGAQGGSGLVGSTVVNGVNGSRDVTATEGTGSYTSNALTVGSKTAQTIKDTPMAVSVLTNQRMQDQNVVDLNSAMKSLPGVSLVQNGGDEFNFYSRGFQISQMQIDGGAAQTFGIQTQQYRPIIDMSLYDHVELVRGATGTFNAYGSPGGVVNLVRKRPLDHPQMLIDMQLGSWDWHRVSVDLTGPIAFDAKLRARLIATHQDNNFFYATSKMDRNVLSATLDFDVTPTTLLTGGYTYQDQHSIPWSLGFPRYFDGTMLPLPRSTSFALPWARDDRINSEFFGQIEQRIGDDWSLKFKATRISQRSFLASPYVGSSPVDPATGVGATVGLGNANLGRTKQTQLEATLDGKFRLFGNVQKIIFGANYSMANYAGSKDFGTLGQVFPGRSTDQFGSYPVDLLKFNINDWVYTPNIYSDVANGIAFSDNRYLNSYASFDFVPFKRVHFISSIRYSNIRSRFLQYYICGIGRQQRNDVGCASQPTGAKVFANAGRANQASRFSWPPSVQAKFDATDNLTFYGGYTDIIIDRSTSLDANYKPLPPTTGGNFEGGAKWLSSNKKINIDLSIYYTKQIGAYSHRVSRGNPAPSVPGELNPNFVCCFVNEPDSYNKSYGFDLEFSGEVLRGWQLAASYTYNTNKKHRPGLEYFDGSESSIESQSPRHLAKIWSTYDFLQGPLAGLRLGFGGQLQSRTFVADSYCLPTAISNVDGSLFCSQYVDVFFSDPGYVIANASVGYKMSDKLRLDLEIENLLDKTYLSSVGNLYDSTFYGTPRNFKLTMRTKF